MNDMWQLEWAEILVDDHSPELFFVEATETPEGWIFSSRRACEGRWQTVIPRELLVLAAEHFKNALLQNRPILGLFVYALRTEQSAFAAIRIVTNVDPNLRVRRAWCGQVILAEMRLNRARHLAKPAASQDPATR